MCLKNTIYIPWLCHQACYPRKPATLIMTKHVTLETEPEPDLMDLNTEPTTHPSRNKEGYPREGIDEV